MYVLAWAAASAAEALNNTKFLQRAQQTLSGLADATRPVQTGNIPEVSNFRVLLLSLFWRQ